MDYSRPTGEQQQIPGSMLCAEHALNNLLQSKVFSAQDLAELARNVDRLEAAQLSSRSMAMSSDNYDDSGFFSVGGESKNTRRDETRRDETKVANFMLM